jgi:hypothetical protein
MDQVSSITHAINELTDSAAIAHPTETIKCKLQLQLVQTGALSRQFAGPIDVVRQTVNGQGITGMWKGVGASFIYRSCFAAMFGGTFTHPSDGTVLTEDRIRDFQQDVQEMGRDELGDVAGYG